MLLNQYLILGGLLLTLTVTAQASEPVASEHRLERGQTLHWLARRYGVTVEALRQANPELVPEALPVGTVVRIPGVLTPEGRVPEAASSPEADSPDPLPVAEEPWLEVVLADGSRAWAPRAALLRPSRTPLDNQGVLSIARRFLGTPYRWGGMTPNGVDCSGYVQEVFELAGHVLPRLADEQFAATVAVETVEARPGDLVFFTTYLPGPSHVGIYLGDGRFLHASSSRGVIEASLSEDYFASRCLGIRRIRPWAQPESSAKLP